jgi:PAS domain S-box-containing protein
MEDRYRQCFEELPFYAAVLDTGLRILEANRRFREDFGDRAGEPCFQVCRGRDSRCPECAAARTLSDGASHRGEEVFLTREGDEVTVSVRTQLIRDPAGHPAGVLKVGADLTDSGDLRSRLSSLGQLVGSISHDIKGHLTGLDGGMYMMQSGYARNDPERVKKGLGMLMRNVERIRNTVLNILYYAKDREPQWAPVSAPALVQELLEAMRKKSEALGIGFSAELAPGLGELDVDPKAIQSMLANLLESAFEACTTDPEKKEHRVRFSVSEEQGHVVFRVMDNGRPLEPDIRERALSSCFPSKILGPGLGLFISNKIAAAHGGTFEVDSVPGVGTTSTVRIPKERS